MEYVNKAVGKVVDSILGDVTIRKATKYISPTTVVKASLRHKYSTRHNQEEFVLTLGKPNYDERHFIKKCIDSKESFPVKKIQFKFWHKKKSKKAKTTRTAQ